MTPCILWKGPQFPNGYGRLNRGYRSLLAHRVAYQKKFGPIPAGLVVMHKCDVRLCVNPEHLQAGTHADNMQDMAAKGRGREHAGLKTKNPNYRHGHCCGTEAEYKAYRAAYRRERRAAGLE